MKSTTSILFILFIFQFILGQKVELLSAELNKYPNVRDFCISADESEAFFTVQSPNQELSQIVVVKNKDWSNPVLLPINNRFQYLEPFLSHDGNRLYFASNRPKNKLDSIASDFDIWFVERKNKNENWSEPINLGENVNTENDEFYPSLAENGNLYFTMDAKSGLGKDDIYYCIWNGKEYSKPVLLNENINSDGYEFNSFVTKDERFLIYTKYNAADGLGSGDLYISHKEENGEWEIAKNMGNVINTKFMEYCPFYDSENGILYFTSKRADLSSQKFNNLREFLEKIMGGENGLSKIYKIKIELK